MEQTKVIKCQAYFVDKVSKNGNPFQMLAITFENGYTHEIFIDKATQFIIKQNQK